LDESDEGTSDSDCDVSDEGDETDDDVNSVAADNSYPTFLKSTR
jgi:hypothetical protein